MSEEHYPKGFMLHRQQTVCKHIYFVTKGVIRSFYLKDGKDITAHFAIDMGVISAADSFIFNRPSRYNLEVLEDTTVYTMTRNELENYLEQHPHYEHTARLFVEELYMDLVDRVEMLMFYSAQERYEALVLQSPDIVQRVSLGHIASYLGITQETLSRVRAAAR
ncbi:Crp/Fnr family transcriptional regulator [Catalinimonas sp. 4WD22]|uniref:Crp/Fnr family transcriptional regulator n=1 Tax=Catalinimonas locisalis TaxID=3133978 RepID=UPI0031014D8D